MDPKPKKPLSARLDSVLLDPKRMRRIGRFMSVVSALIIIGIVLNQMFLAGRPDPTAYYALWGVCVFLVAAVCCVSLAAGLMRSKRLKAFNAIDHEPELLAKMASDPAVASIAASDDPAEQIPAETLVCANVPAGFSYGSKSRLYRIGFNDGGLVLEYCVIDFVSKAKNARDALFGTKKVLAIRLPSLDPRPFYLARRPAAADLPRRLSANGSELVLAAAEANFRVYAVNENERFDFNAQTLNSVFFDPLKTQALFDLHNGPACAYLLVTVPATFMDSGLRASESVADFDRNLAKQAEYDVTLLSVARANARIAIAELFAPRANG